jgi:hypothetical protein
MSVKLEQKLPLEEALEQAREELRHLQATGRRVREQQAQEVAACREQLNQATSSFRETQTIHLSSHQSPIYMKIMKDVYETTSSKNNDLPPIYVLRTQAKLLEAMHRDFSILPTQLQIVQGFYVSFFEYMEKSIQEQRLASKENLFLDDVSHVAAANNELYEEAQKEIHQQEEEIKQLRKSLRSSGKPDHDDLSTVDCSDTSVSEGDFLLLGSASDHSSTTSRLHSSFKSLTNSISYFTHHEIHVPYPLSPGGGSH